MEALRELLPNRLKELWQSFQLNRITYEEFNGEQDRLLDEYRKIWTEALSLEGMNSLDDSLHTELGRFTGCTDLREVRRLCSAALDDVRAEWEGKVASDAAGSVQEFYDGTRAMMYELMHWHSLADDNSPLAYVLALRIAELYGCSKYLDFGSGVGSGAILFAGRGFDATLADISSPLLEFSRWRMELRNLPARYLDLKTEKLPDGTFDMVAAMDVFEHLVDPVSAVDQLWRAMKPGGILFGRFHAEEDEDRPQHIVADFEPTLRRFDELGFTQIWRDDWLWGHQAFRKG